MIKIRNLWNKKTLELVFFIILSLITTLLYRVIDKEMDLRMDILKKEIIQYIESQLKHRISYNSISPSIFMFLEVRNLKIYSNEYPEREVFKFKKIRVNYNLFNLIFSADPLTCISEIDISNSFFDFAFIDTDTEETQRSELQKTFLSRITSNDYTFKISGKQVRLSVKTEGIHIDCSDLFFEIRSIGDSYDLQVRNGNIKVNITNGSGDFSWFFSKLKIKGEVNRDFSKTDLIVRVSSFSSDYFKLAKQTLQVTLKENILDIVKIQDKAPIDLHYIQDFTTNNCRLNFKTEKFKPSSMVKLLGQLNTFNSWLGSSITSAGELAFKIGETQLSYKIDTDILLDNPLFPPDITLSSHLHGDEKMVFFQPLVIESNLGTIDFTGNMLFKNFFPEGFLRLVNIKAITGKKISADFQLVRKEQSLSLKGSKLVVGTSIFKLFSLDIYPELAGWYFALNASFAKSIIDNRIVSTGWLKIDPELKLEFSGRLEDIPSSNIYKLVIQEKYFSQSIFNRLGSYTVNTGFSLNTDFKEMEYKVSDFLLKDGKENQEYLKFSINGTGKQLEVEDIKAIWANYSLFGSINAKFNSDGGFSFLSSCQLEGVPYSVMGYYTPGIALHINGSYGLNLSFIFSKKKEILMTAKALKLPIPYNAKQKHIFYTSFSINGIYSDKKGWQIVSPSTIFENIPVFRLGDNILEFNYVLNREELFISEIYYKDEISTLIGHGKFDINEGDTFSLFGDLGIYGRETLEEYYLKGRLGLEFVDAYILFNSFPLERLGNLVVSGSLSGQINFNGLVAEPDMDIKIILEKGSLNADKVGFQSHLVINEDLFTLESLSFSYRDNRLANGSGIIDKRNGQFQFNSYYFGNFFNNDIVSNLFFEGIIKDIEDGSFFNLFDKEIEGTLNVSNITVEDEKYKSWNIRMSKMRDSLHITGGPDNVINFSLYEAEKFKIQIGSPFPVQCKASGLIKGKTIDAIIEEIQIDMGIFNLMLGINIIQFKSGIAYGKELTISGYINDPDFEGYMKVNDVRLAFFLSKDDSEPFDTNLIFHEKTFRMGETKLLVGNGILWANKGIFYLDHWMPAAFDLEFRSDNNVGLHCVYDFGPVFVDGYAVGSVSTHGNRTTIWVDGNIEAKYCAITLSDTVKTGESGDFGMNLIVNINFVSGRKVEFLWPTQAFPVLKCYSKQDSKLDISYNSDEGAFSMNGSVGIKGGEVFYFNRNFYLKEGNILFNIFNPESIDPRISIRAEMREIDEDGELVYIYLVANNNILSEFSPRFESSPVMTEEEIFRLLGRSITERIEERGLGLSVFLLSTEVITEVGFFRSFEQTVRDIFGLDLFSIRTQLIENVLLDKIVDSTEQEEVDNRVSLGKYLDNTTITFGQNLGDDLLLSGLVRLKEVDYYSPETVMESGFFGVEPEFEISIDWPTPFFNLEWTFNLAQEHLNDLYFYLTDNTIKFTWNFTY